MQNTPTHLQKPDGITLGVILQLESRKASDILKKDQCLYTSLENNSLIGNMSGKH